LTWKRGEPVPEFIEETLRGDAEILVAFWGGKETVLEEVGEERRTGEGFEEGEIADGLLGRGGIRAWTKR
jgi:hypothetical protein